MNTKPSHPWKARFLIGFLMLIFGFISLMLINIDKEGAWNYLRLMCIFSAVICFWLNWYTHREKTTAWVGLREVAHWCGLWLAVYLISIFVNIGIMSRFLASLQVLTLLALTVFLLGVYTEPALIVVGVILGAFAGGAAYVEEYLYTIMLPIMVISAVVLFFVVRHQQNKHFTEH